MPDRYRSVADKVCRTVPLSKESLKTKLATAWGRVWPKFGGQGSYADAFHTDSQTVGRVLLCKNLPEAHTIFNSLCADQTALDEILAHYGLKAAPLISEAANDMSTISALSGLVSQFCEALEDGIRDHRETCQLAESIRPLMLSLTAIVQQADKIRSAA